MLKKSRPATGCATPSTRVRLKVAVVLVSVVILGIVFNSGIWKSEAEVAAASNLDTNSYNSLTGLNIAANSISGTSTNLNGKTANDPSTNPDSSSLSVINGQPFQYFSSTGHSLTGTLLHYYMQTGGQNRHGSPLTEIIAVKGHYYQFFQNSVFEFDPRYTGSPDEVKMLPLGSILTAGANFAPITPFVNSADHWYFPETSHSLSDGFLNFWLNNGGRSTLGLPISEEMQTKDESGPSYTVQYFQYSRLEYHPDATDPSLAIRISTLGLQQANQMVPATSLNPIALNVLTAPRSVHISSLMFHYVRLVDPKKDPLGYGLSVTPDNFIKYLDWLQANNFHTVTISQIYDYLRYGIPLPDKPVNIRFDDGHSDQWFAYQEMQKRGMTANFFVITRRLELTPQQWQQIDQDGFEVAAHTRTHPDLKNGLNLEAEIAGSKQDIEAMLGHPVRTFAYPYGSYGPTILKIVKDSGFEVAVSTNGGVEWNLEKTLVEPTIEVTGRDSLQSFAAKAQMNLPDLTVASSSHSSPTKAASKATPVPVKSSAATSNKSKVTATAKAK